MTPEADHLRSFFGRRARLGKKAAATLARIPSRRETSEYDGFPNRDGSRRPWRVASVVLPVGRPGQPRDVLHFSSPLGRRDAL